MKQISLPWSKSITNRDFILASLSSTPCSLKSVLKSDDTEYMIKALQKLGIEIEKKDDKIIFYGWIDKFKETDEEIYVGQSWTCMRFLTGLFPILSLRNFEKYPTFTGEERLLQRPMKELIEWIQQMGLELEHNNFLAPVSLKWWKIKNNKIKMNWTSSSQFFTALLNVGALIPWWIEIEVNWDLVSKPYIDLTIEELRKFNVKDENYDYKKFIVKEQEIVWWELEVEWDASALSYIANFVILHWWTVKVTNIGKNTKQWDYYYLEILKKYFDFDYEATEKETVLKANKLNRTKLKALDEIDFEYMPDVSMSFMSLAIFLPWKTKIIGLKTLNLKECKRIDAMKTELEKLGVEVEADNKSMIIWEYNQDFRIETGFQDKKIDIETYNDHRIAMVFGVLNTYFGNLNILNPSCVNKTYPRFWEDVKSMMNYKW